MPLLAAALVVALAGAAEVPGDQPDMPRLRYDGGEMSVNDRCPVRHRKLNPAIEPLWINGKPLGFC